MLFTQRALTCIQRFSPVVHDNMASTEDVAMTRIVQAVTMWFRRAWLRSRLDSYQRSLHAIVAQRENDFHAERLLHRAISSARSKLQSL
jgi:hypothetical protein